jgi:uncharacterized protein (TIGR00251 family)
MRFTETAAGVSFAVKVQPRARRNAVAGGVGEALKVQVTAPPEDGRANEAVVELLAETLGIKRRQVKILTGTTSREKVVRVSGMSRGELATRLAS